jgi:hypothetical protein
MDKLKGAVNAVTGGAAKVTLEFEPAVAFAGDTIRVKISATSTGSEVKSKGVFVDLHGVEEVTLNRGDAPNLESSVRASKNSFQQEFRVAPEFVLAPNETKLFEGQVQIPSTALPSFDGKLAQHKWQIRGRVEAMGNDPDSGFKPIKISLK